MNFKGQNGQDKFVLETFFKKKDGTYKTDGRFIDIGAHNGVDLSASYVFEELGWDGICIEPMVEQYEQLKQARKCQAVNATISDLINPYVTFNKIIGHPEAEMLSGIVEKYDPRHIERIKKDLAYFGAKTESRIIRNYTFNELIEPGHIDVLFVDTEGGEQEILNSIDFSKYEIDIICFEDNFYDYKHENSPLKDRYDWVKAIYWDYVISRKGFKPLVEL